MTSGVIFAELHAVAGERLTASDRVGVATSPVLSLFKRRRGQLFTVTDPSRQGAEAICRQLIETIEDEYFRVPSRSITRSLQAAIDVGNEMLRAENAKLSSEQQLRVGICCAAVRDGDVFVAQVAPATAFILHHGIVTRVFGTQAVSEANSGEGYASDSLGSRVDPHVSFGFSPIEDGDLVLLATGANWKIIPDKYILDAARQIDPEMAAQALYVSFTAHVRRPTTSMIVIKMADLPARIQGGDSERRTRVAGKRNSSDKPRESDRPRDEAKIPVGVVEASELDAGLPSRKGRPRTSIASKPSLNASDLDEWRFPRRTNGYAARPPAAERTAVRQPRSSTGLSAWDKLRLSLGRGQKPAARLPGQPPARKASVKLRTPPQMRGDRRGRSNMLGQLLLLIALATLFVVVGNAAISLWKSWQIGDPQVLLKQAGEKQAAAAAADNPVAARTALAQAADLINRALQAKDDQSTRAMATSVQANIDRMDAVVRIDKASTVVDLSTIVQDKGDVTQVVVDGQNLYLLDDGQNRLFKYLLAPDGRGVQDAGKHPVLMKKGDRVDGKPIAEMLNMAWMPAGQLRTQPGLFVLDSGRSVVLYDNKVGSSRVDVSDSGRWGAIQAMAGFAGGLYLLDTKQKNVYYYPPTKNGYESQPYVIVDANGRADLSKAIDIALDGNLYVLDESGTIRRFTREGRPLDFVGDVPDGKVAGAKMLFASAATRSVYELDAGGERILQFSPEGKFQRQFRTDGKSVSFKDARDLYVDEAGRKIYLLLRNSLLVFDLPAMQ